MANRWRVDPIRALPVLAAALLSTTTGCISLSPVESTPEGITAAVAPGDTVRMTTRNRGEIVMRVQIVTDYDLRGRIEDGSGAFESVRYDRIDAISVERLNMKKAMLTTLVPAVIGAVIVCNHSDCESRSVLTATP
jgi:hypothetical protein